MLERLVALNAQRAAEEKRGLIRWLRPEFQNAQGTLASTELEIDSPDVVTVVADTRAIPWPKALPDQVRAVADVIAHATEPLDEAAIAARFSARGRWRERLPTILDTLAAIGRIRSDDNQHYTAI